MAHDLKERLASLADVVRERPDALARLAAFRGRRARRRRIVTAAVAVLFASASTALLVRAFGSTTNDLGTEPTVSPTVAPASVVLSETYQDQVGWSIDYPPGWTVLPINSTGRVTIQGAAFSNGPLVPASGDGQPYPDLSKLGRDDVVLIVTHRSGGPGPTFGDDSHFPLDPADAHVIPGPGPVSSVLDFRGDGLDAFEARFGGWGGGHPDLYDTLERMIRTIRFKPWELGDVRNGFAAISGDIQDGRGESGLVPRLGLIYEMRIGGVPYVLDVPDVSCEGQNQAWDPVRKQILLEGPCYQDIRYDVDGAPDPANPPGYQQPLERHPVVRAWDGTLLVALDFVVSG
jgi:hypothetical protein